METIPKRLIWLRGHAALSARALSVLAGLHPTHIGLIERGDRTDPSSSAMAAIANVLGCSMDWLVAGRGQAPSREEIASAVARARGQTRGASRVEEPAAKSSGVLVVREGFDQRNGTEG